jgi:hypothetical protein
MDVADDTPAREGAGAGQRICLPPVVVAGRAGFVPPPGACDAHVHVFADPARHPYAEERSFTPAPGLSLEALDRLHQALGFDRSVIVQTGIQSPDVVLEVLRAEPDQLRGVAVLKGDATDEGHGHRRTREYDDDPVDRRNPADAHGHIAAGTITDTKKVAEVLRTLPIDDKSLRKGHWTGQSFFGIRAPRKPASVSSFTNSVGYPERSSSSRQYSPG